MVSLEGSQVIIFHFVAFHLQEVFHVYLNKFEIAVTNLFLIIFCNN